MIFAAYNVQSGGFPTYHDYETTKPPRLEAIQGAVNEIGADVVGLTDTFRWHELYSKSDLRTMFGYEHAIAIPISDPTMGCAGKSIGITLLSKRELINPEPINLGDRQALGAGIELDDGTVLSLLTAYLHHANEVKRVAQSTALTNYAYAKRPGKLERAAVIGDLNTESRSDRTAQLLGRVLRLLPASRGEGHVADAVGVLQGDAYQHFIEQGFKDANQRRTATMPTQKHRILGRIAIPPIFRVDHILHSPDLQATQCAVLKGEVFGRASDHFPVVADLAASHSTN